MAKTQSIPQVVAQILTARGLAEGDQAAFVYPDYDKHLHDPFLLTDMEPAVERILAAAQAEEKVVIYGDYDIDGITASAIMIETLRSLGLETTSYIPDRFEEGYGINGDALASLKADGADLVISVDCGITSAVEAAWARDNGLDLIITDHHAVPAEIPEAIAVINPKRPGDVYPFKDLCGAGVAFKLAQALQQRSGQPEPGQEKWLLDLVALGTVCDVVSLTGENRVLVTYGLKVMRRTRRVGLRALAEVGGIDIATINSHHLGFVLGPRLNAAGRLEHAARSVELMLTDDEARAAEVAAELDMLNRQRRADQATIVAGATEQAAQYADEPVLLLADEAWSHGIVGIAASKLVDSLSKPVLVAQIMGDTTKGSARSTGDFNMIEALRSMDDLFIKYGGHFFAAGYTLPTDRLDEFRRRLGEYYRSSGATSERLETAAEVNLGDLDQVDWALLDALTLLEPFGTDNPEPLLALVGLTVASRRTLGAEGSHLKLTLTDGTTKLDAIGFGLASRYNDLTPGTVVTAVGSLSKNEWNGQTSIQLTLKALQYEQN